MEYALLTIVCLSVYLSLGIAFNAFTATAGMDATEIAASHVAAAVSASITDVAGKGDISASKHILLPEKICGRPYFVYPSQDGRHLILSVDGEPDRREYRTPVLVTCESWRIEGFIASDQRDHMIVYDAVSRTVSLS